MRLPARMRDVLKRYGLALALAGLALLIRDALPVPEGTTSTSFRLSRWS